jgi:cytochrome c
MPVGRRTPWTAALALLCVGLLCVGLPAAASEQLAARKACLGCHTVASARVGPAFQAVATRYAGDAGALERLARKVREGSRDTWGVVPMPPNPRVSEAEARELARWVLAQRPAR